MSLAQLWATFYAARWRILLMVAVATGVAYYLADGLPRQYTAKARVMLDIGNPDPAQYSQLKRFTEGDYIGTQMRLAAGDDVARAVVTQLGWPDNPQVIAAWQAGDRRRRRRHQMGGGAAQAGHRRAADRGQLDHRDHVYLVVARRRQADRRAGPHRLHRPEPQGSRRCRTPRGAVERDRGGDRARRAAQGRSRARRLHGRRTRSRSIRPRAGSISPRRTPR